MAVANSITYSTEYRSRLITGSYQQYLGRGPDGPGLAQWLVLMNRGLTIEQMERGFLASDEYFGRAGGTPRGWITALYRDVLDRVPSASETSAWTNVLAGGTNRASVALGFLLSSEHLGSVVNDQYTSLLRRSIDSSGRSTWVGAIQRGTRLEAVIGSIVASDEYAAKNGGRVAVTSPVSSVPASTSQTGYLPTSGEKPGPSNTGVPAGTSLKASGSITVTQANTVLDGLDVSGSITVKASGVVIKNTKVHGSGSYGIYVASGSVAISDSEIYGGFENAIGFGNWTATRVNIHGTTGDGVKLGSNVTLQDSWIHDLTPGPSAHADGAQLQSGEKNIVIKHNVIDLASTPRANAALFLAPDLGPSSDGPLTITDNWLDGGNYTVFCVDGNNGQYLQKNITISNNRFGRGAQYGPARVNVPITQSGNVWADTGASLNL